MGSSGSPDIVASGLFETTTPTIHWTTANPNPIPSALPVFDVAYIERVASYLYQRMANEWLKELQGVTSKTISLPSCP